MLGEELRLLYVAMTRARDTLLVSGSISSSQGDRLWQPVRASALRSWPRRVPTRIGSVRGSRRIAALPRQGLATARMTWCGGRYTTTPAWWSPPTPPRRPSPPCQGGLSGLGSARAAPALGLSLSGRHAPPAKAAVTALRRGAGDQDQEAASLFGGQPTRPSPAKAPAPTQPPRARRSGGKPGATAAALAGQAHHAFLELVPLAAAGAAPEMRRAAKRLQEQGLLAEEDVGLLDFGGLAAFWQSDLGGKIRGQAQFVRRGLAFTARFSPQEIAAITGEPLVPGLEDEFIVVQGVADLAVVLPAEIWLVDFKTDAVEPSGLDERARLYAPQVKLYARALSQIYRRPVSAAWLYFLQARTAVPVQ